MEIWSKLTTHASCWAHVQLIICTQFQCAGGFARTISARLGQEKLNTRFFFLSFLSFSCLKDFSKVHFLNTPINYASAEKQKTELQLKLK